MTRDPRAGCLGLLALLALAIVPLGTPSGMFFPVMVLLAGGCAVLMWRSLPTVNSQDGYAWVAIAITALLLMLGMRMLAYEDPGGAVSLLLPCASSSSAFFCPARSTGKAIQHPAYPSNRVAR